MGRVGVHLPGRPLACPPTSRSTNEPKSAGKAPLKSPASATLERRGDETWNAVAQKIDDVNIEIQRLLGLTAEQFQQVVLLPQGRFERVLRSSSEDREQLLRTLFDTATFASASQWLDDEAKRRREHRIGPRR